MYREVNEMHTRLLQVTLIAQESQVFWEKYHDEVTIEEMYEEYWFGDINKATVRNLFNNLKNRFVQFPHSLYALQKWKNISIAERNIVCHWHLQLSDPLYRKFTASYLYERFLFPPATTSRDDVILWISHISQERWRRSTQVQFASKLASCAKSVGFIEGNKDPRNLKYPPVSSQALSYLFYLLREIDIAGSLMENPYLKSVGLEGSILQTQLRQCRDINVQKMGDIVEFNWKYKNLREWADAREE